MMPNIEETLTFQDSAEFSLELVEGASIRIRTLSSRQVASGSIRRK